MWTTQTADTDKGLFGVFFMPLNFIYAPMHIQVALSFCLKGVFSPVSMPHCIARQTMAVIQVYIVFVRREPLGNLALEDREDRP